MIAQQKCWDCWQTRDDSFAFVIKPALPVAQLTRRVVLSETDQIFDPLGFLTPVSIRAKVLFQELWLLKLGWDDPLPTRISTRWMSLREDFSRLAGISLRTWLNTWSDTEDTIHGFSDASQLAMAAAVYIVVSSSSTVVQANLVCSKTKVAPLKPLTIPRLELAAALLLSKLVKYVQATIRRSVRATHLWTDSQVAFTWIKSPPARWKDFVKNRISQIQDLTASAHWHHVPGTSNLADCASRGITTAQLKEHSLWWHGPASECGNGRSR